jgi:hypothetical protein
LQVRQVFQQLLNVDIIERVASLATELSGFVSRKLLAYRIKTSCSLRRGARRRPPSTLCFVDRMGFALAGGQTFFYGVSDSGLTPYHNLFNSSFSGPRWLTGGTVGPEASIFTPITLLIVAVVFSFVYREIRYQPLGIPNQ